MYCARNSPPCEEGTIGLQGEKPGERLGGHLKSLVKGLSTKRAAQGLVRSSEQTLTNVFTFPLGLKSPVTSRNRGLTAFSNSE